MGSPIPSTVLNNLANPGAAAPQFGPNWQQVGDAARVAIAIQNAKQVQQAQNALQAFANTPNALDLKTMAADPAAMATLFRSSPPAFMDLSNNLATIQEKQARGTILQSKVSQDKQSEAQLLRGEWLSAYDGYMKSGMSQQAAYNRATEEVWAPGIKSLKQGLSPDQQQRIPSAPDPIQVRNNFNAYETAKAAPKAAEAAAMIPVDVAKQKALEPGEVDKAIAIKNATGKVAEGPLLTAKTPDGKEIEVRQARNGVGYLDANTGNLLIPDKDYVANSVQPKKADAATDDQARATAEAIYELRQPPLSSYAMRSNAGPKIMEALKQIGEERGHPYNAQDYATGLRLRTGYASTTPNSAGGQMNSINTAVQHLDQLKDLEAALKNHDEPALNRVINYVQTQLGHPEVTNFDTAAQIISDEVLKSVIGSGAVFDRSRLQEQLTNTRAPDQIGGGIKTIEGLMGGRLNSMRQQWTSIGLPEAEWQAKLTPDAAETLTPYMKKSAETPKSTSAATALVQSAPPSSNAAGLPSPATPADAMKLPPGTQYVTPDGRVMVR